LGIPLTPEMDGDVLDIFDEELNQARISERRGTSGRHGIETAPFTSEETSEIEAKLRGLGYLE
jgi:hypothetical protein